MTQSVAILYLENITKSTSMDAVEQIGSRIEAIVHEALLQDPNFKYARIEFSVEKPAFNVIIYPDCKT